MWLLKKCQRAGGTLGGLFPFSAFVAWPLASAGRERPVMFPSEQAALKNLRNSLRFQVTTIKQEKSY